MTEHRSGKAVITAQCVQGFAVAEIKIKVIPVIVVFITGDLQQKRLSKVTGNGQIDLSCQLFGKVSGLYP